MLEICLQRFNINNVTLWFIIYGRYRSHRPDRPYCMGHTYWPNNYPFSTEPAIFIGKIKHNAILISITNKNALIDIN